MLPCHEGEPATKTTVRIDVSDATGTGEELALEASVFVSDATTANGLAMFAYPGGGYNRHYYDLQLAEGPGYSQAEYHGAQGFIFVAVDHLGTGASSVPTKPLDYDAVARANTDAARQIFDRLKAGTLDPAIPSIDLRSKVAMGQSFGGFLLTIAQGSTGYFDGVAILGSSAIQTVPPWDAHIKIEDIASGAAGNGLQHPMRRFFHYPDVPESIVMADLTKTPGSMAGTAPWSASTAPGGPALASTRGPLDRGAVAAEAAAIEVPVFIGSGEIDVIAEPRAEPAAYSRSPDITVAVYAQMAHMHNFATTRRQLWERLAYWADGITVIGLARSNRA